MNLQHGDFFPCPESLGYRLSFPALSRTCKKICLDGAVSSIVRPRTARQVVCKYSGKRGSQASPRNLSALRLLPLRISGLFTRVGIIRLSSWSQSLSLKSKLRIDSQSTVDGLRRDLLLPILLLIDLEVLTVSAMDPALDEIGGDPSLGMRPGDQAGLCGPEATRGKGENVPGNGARRFLSFFGVILFGDSGV